MIEKEIDLSALYLYSDNYGHRIGRVIKVNEKSVRMEYGVKLDMEVFKSLHKLTDEEVSIANREFIKHLADTNRSIRGMIEDMRSLKALLNGTFSSLDSEKLQNEIDNLINIISNDIKAFDIAGKSFRFRLHSERLVEMKEA